MLKTSRFNTITYAISEFLTNPAPPPKKKGTGVGGLQRVDGGFCKSYAIRQ